MNDFRVCNIICYISIDFIKKFSIKMEIVLWNKEISDYTTNICINNIVNDSHIT